MTDDLHDLAALAALGAIDPTDAERLAAAIDADPELAAQLQRDRETVAALERVGARTAAPDLAGRLVAMAQAEAATDAAPEAARAPRRRRWIPALGLAAAAAAAAVAITVVATRDGGLGTPDVEATIAASGGSAGPQGTVALYRPQEADGRIVLDVATGPAPSGHHYEVWVLREGSDHMESVGVFNAAGAGTVHLELPLPGAGTYAAMDISVEDDGGPPEHSGTSVAGATLRST